MWSMGCIFAEMLLCVVENKTRVRDRVCFPGKCCNPLTPSTNGASPNIQSDKDDQLKLII